MNTCGTCKHKGVPITAHVDGQIRETRFFLCNRVKHNPGARGDEHGYGSGSLDDTEAPRGSGAFVVDGSGYYAALCVEEDFGCIKWEAR